MPVIRARPAAAAAIAGLLRLSRPRRCTMPSPTLNRSRFIAGLVLVIVAVLLYVFARGEFSTAGAIAIGTLGLVSIAVSRKG
jgi:uncharacterized membrane protein